MMTTGLILVGGFLGAGKTTLLWEAALRLARRGQRVGPMTNDRAPELVDTAFLSRGDVKVHGWPKCARLRPLPTHRYDHVVTAKEA